MLKNTIFFLLCGISIGLSMPHSGSLALQDTTVADSVTAPVPDFKGVNVIVETDWGTTDKTENVDVFIKKEKNQRTEIVMKKSDHQECIVELISGMVVKIVNRKTGKVLKTFKK